MNFSLPSSRLEAVGRILERIDATADAVRPAFPLAADVESGIWRTAADGRWAGGFWVGMLWRAFHHTKQAKYLLLAREWMSRLVSRITVDNVLNGLVFYYGAALGALLADDSRARSLALDGARALDRRFDQAAGVFPLGLDTTEMTSGGGVETNIDGLAGVTLLLWSADAANEPAFMAHALSHARRLQETCQRSDGSLYQAAIFNRNSGAIERRFTPRGYAEESAWARAQSWGLLGFVQAARWDTALVSAARRVADFWIDRTRTDPIAFWDFDDPSIPTIERDTSATAMAAASLLKLAALTPESEESRRYRAHAEVTIDKLVQSYLTPTRLDDHRPPGILTEGCWQHNQKIATEHELIWGDYFLLEALLQLEARLPLI